MAHTLAVVAFLAIMSLAAIYLFRQLVPRDDNCESDSRIKRVGDDQKATQPQPEAPPEPLDHDEPSHNRSRPAKGLAFMPMLILATAGYLIYTNQDLIAAKIPAAVTELSKEKPKEAISVANVDGHAVVDGVNWFKLVATSTTGVPFEGWVSELAIQKQPPEENKMADEMMKKLGVQTNKERLENVKRIRKVGEALDTALKDFRPKND